MHLSDIKLRPGWNGYLIALIVLSMWLTLFILHWMISSMSEAFHHINFVFKIEFIYMLCNVVYAMISLPLTNGGAKVQIGEYIIDVHMVRTILADELIKASRSKWFWIGPGIAVVWCAWFVRHMRGSLLLCVFYLCRFTLLDLSFNLLHLSLEQRKVAERVTRFIGLRTAQYPGSRFIRDKWNFVVKVEEPKYLILCMPVLGVSLQINYEDLSDISVKSEQMDIVETYQDLSQLPDWISHRDTNQNEQTVVA